MFPFIFIILLVVLLVIMVVPAIILSLISTVLSWFGIGKKRRYTYTRTYTNRGNENFSGRGKENSAWQNEKPRKREKLFDKSDGEYVEFEEIKD